MTEIEQKALEMISAARKEHPTPDNYLIARTALCRAIERHEAFRQEVSDVVYRSLMSIAKGCAADAAGDLSRFVIPAPKPDPLVEALVATDGLEYEPQAEAIRAALKACGFEIREKNDDPAPVPVR